MCVVFVFACIYARVVQVNEMRRTLIEDRELRKRATATGSVSSTGLHATAVEFMEVLEEKQKKRQVGAGGDRWAGAMLHHY